MLPVVDAIVAVRPEGQEPGEGADGHVEPPRPEGRAVRRLVEGAEGEGERVPVDEEQGEDPGRGPELPEEGAGDHERSEMPDRPKERRPVRAAHQVVEIFPRELMGGEPDERVLSHRRTEITPT